MTSRLARWCDKQTGEDGVSEQTGEDGVMSRQARMV